MYRVRQEDLPFKGSSHHFVGAIKAGEIHAFKCIGDAPLVHVDVHVSPRFIQENLE